jgi:hypothetical protein
MTFLVDLSKLDLTSGIMFSLFDGLDSLFLMVSLFLSRSYLSSISLSFLRAISAFNLSNRSKAFASNSLSFYSVDMIY